MNKYKNEIDKNINKTFQTIVKKNQKMVQKY